MGDEASGTSSANPPGEPSTRSGWTTTKQAAKVLGVSRRSVQEYVHRGLLEARVEGDGVGKTFYLSIDSLNALRHRRSEEAHSPDVFAEGSPQNSETTNPIPNTGEALRHVVDRLEARTAEATELRVRLELTEKAQSTLAEQLAEERRRREEAERERDELRRRLEAAPGPRDEPQSAPEPSKGPSPRSGTTGRQEGVQEHSAAAERPTEETARRPWWRRILGG